MNQLQTSDIHGNAYSFENCVVFYSRAIPDTLQVNVSTHYEASRLIVFDMNNTNRRAYEVAIYMTVGCIQPLNLDHTHIHNDIETIIKFLTLTIKCIAPPLLVNKIDFKIFLYLPINNPEIRNNIPVYFEKHKSVKQSILFLPLQTESDEYSFSIKVDDNYKVHAGSIVLPNVQVKTQWETLIIDRHVRDEVNGGVKGIGGWGLGKTASSSQGWSVPVFDIEKKNMWGEDRKSVTQTGFKIPTQTSLNQSSPSFGQSQPLGQPSGPSQFPNQTVSFNQPSTFGQSQPFGQSSSFNQPNNLNSNISFGNHQNTGINNNSGFSAFNANSGGNSFGANSFGNSTSTAFSKTSNSFGNTTNAFGKSRNTSNFGTTFGQKTR
jgi:hypothetical protein